MSFNKELDSLDDYVTGKNKVSQETPRRSFNIGGVPPAEGLNTSNLASTAVFGSDDTIIETAPDVNDQTLVQVLSAGTPATIIQRSLPKIASKKGILRLVTVGVLFGFLVAVTILVSRGVNKGMLDGAKTTAIAPVTPETNVAPELQADIFSLPQTDFQEQIAVQESVIVPESGIVEYANSQPVQVAPRQFLYAKDSQRTYGSSLAKPDYSPKLNKKTSPVTARNLKKIDKNGRYKDNQSGGEWQGDWQLNSPKNNIKRAETYRGYAQSQGSRSLDSLKVIQQPKNSLLKNAKGASLSPKLSK